MIYVLIRAKTGEFLSAWSTPELAVESRNSLSLFGDKDVHILAYELDKINEWSVYYD